jgi:acetyl esterase/lipase
MAINKAMQAAIRALSYPDVKLKKTYKIVRGIGKITHPYYLKPFFKTWDHELIFVNHKIPVRIFADPEKEEKEEKLPVLLFFHGGGWVTGDIGTYNNVCAVMAKMTGCRVISVDYRLAPEHKFPAGLEDCYFAAKEIILHAEEHFGIDPADVTLIGDSAGGNFCAAVSLMARDRGEFMPSRQILLYPAVNNDFSERSQFSSIRENGTDYILTRKRLCDYMDLYQSSPADRMNPYFAPYLAKDLSGQPDTLVITAEYDPLRDEGEAYARRLLEAGNHVEMHRIKDALHGFFSLSVKFEPVEICYGYMNEFLGYQNVKKQGN